MSLYSKEPHYFGGGAKAPKRKPVKSKSAKSKSAKSKNRRLPNPLDACETKALKRAFLQGRGPYAKKDGTPRASLKVRLPSGKVTVWRRERLLSKAAEKTKPRPRQKTGQASTAALATWRMAMSLVHREHPEIRNMIKSMSKDPSDSDGYRIYQEVKETYDSLLRER
jgi:hypothetical protein